MAQFTRTLCDCGCGTRIVGSRRFAKGHGAHRQRIKCACGCGALVPWTAHAKYRRPRFIRSHHFRGVNRTVKPPKNWRVPSGLCECGCGERTSIAKQTTVRLDHYRGFPLRFIQGHNPRFKRPEGRVAFRLKHVSGYIKVQAKGNPMADSSGYVMEHRLVLSRVLGRPLTRDEYGHHLNGNRRDNLPENLEVWTRMSPPGQRVKDLVAWARALLVRYGAEFPES